MLAVTPRKFMLLTLDRIGGSDGCFGGADSECRLNSVNPLVQRA